MKIGNIIYYIFLQNVKEWKKRIVFQSLMLCFFLSLTCILVLVTNAYQEEYWASQMLVEEIDEYYIVYSNLANENMNYDAVFAKQLREAGYRYTSVSGLVQIDFDKNTDLMELQNELQIKKDVVKNLKRIDKLFGYENTSIDGESLETAIEHVYSDFLMGIVVSEDTFLDFKDLVEQEVECPEQDGVKFLYLGANLHSIPLGSQYTNSKNEKFVVKGYIKDGKSVFASDHMIRCMREDISFHIALDDLVIVQENMDGLMGSMIYHPKKDFEMIQNDIQNMTKDLDGEVSLVPITKIRNEAYAFLLPYKQLVRKLIWAFGITTILTILTYQLNDMYVDKRKYRIWYETGFSKRDMIKMQFIDYTSQFVGNAIIALIIGNLYLSHYYNMVSSYVLADKIADLGTFVFISSVTVIIIALVLGVISSLLPVIYLNQKKPIDFM